MKMAVTLRTPANMRVNSGWQIIVCHNPAADAYSLQIQSCARSTSEYDTLDNLASLGLVRIIVVTFKLFNRKLLGKFAKFCI